VSLSLSMALHELATNALKYGALSVPGGRIVIRWSVGREEGTPYPTKLRIHWAESGGPPVAEPAQEGFGSRLLRVTAAELKGETETLWKGGGLQWSLEFPLASSDFELPG
jgi:two-component sensor histidine kinase